VAVVKNRIAEIQRQLGDAIKEEGPIIAAPSAVPLGERVNFAEQLISLEASYHSVAAQEEAMRKQVAELRNSLQGLSNSELDYLRVNREAESSRALYAMLSDKLTAARIREQGEMRVVKVIDPPFYAQPAMGQRRLMLLFAGFAVAVVAGTSVPAVFEWLHGCVESEDDIEIATRLPVLATIPRMRTRPQILGADHEADARAFDERFLFTEAVRTLRVSLQLAMRSDGIRTVLVTSPFAHEGKSMVVTNLALALAEVGVRVVVADSDLERPMLHKTLSIKETRGGLVKMLRAEQSLQETLVPAGDNIWLVPRGDVVHPHTRGLLATSRLRELLEEMASEAEVVIADSSPVLLMPENLFLAGSVDAVLLVAKAGSTPCRDLARAKILLENAGAKVAGVVINEMPVSALRGRYRRYYKSYVKSYAKKDGT
jgi:capsular exopolysaccharide synthesis family protein